MISFFNRYLIKILILVRKTVFILRKDISFSQSIHINIYNKPHLDLEKTIYNSLGNLTRFLTIPPKRIYPQINNDSKTYRLKFKIIFIILEIEIKQIPQSFGYIDLKEIWRVKSYNLFVGLSLNIIRIPLKYFILKSMQNHKRAIQIKDKNSTSWNFSVLAHFFIKRKKKNFTLEFINLTGIIIAIEEVMLKHILDINYRLWSVNHCSKITILSFQVSSFKLHDIYTDIFLNQTTAGDAFNFLPICVFFYIYPASNIQESEVVKWTPVAFYTNAENVSEAITKNSTLKILESDKIKYSPEDKQITFLGEKFTVIPDSKNRFSLSDDFHIINFDSIKRGMNLYPHVIDSFLIQNGSITINSFP